MIVKFEKVEERDVDITVMRAFVQYPGFADLFLAQCGYKGAEVISVEHSLMDIEWGESDITVIVEQNGTRHGLLIENKIDADAMPEQCSRYQKRGQIGVEREEYKDFSVFIIAPSSYLDTDAEAKKYPNRLSYESILNYFDGIGAEFDGDVLRGAILKKEAGYTVREIRPITEFWQELYCYTKCSGYKVEMYEAKGAKGSRSAWPRFREPLNGTALYFKSKQGAVDLEFTGKLSDGGRLRVELNRMKSDDMHWVDTGNSISLRIKVNPMEFRNSFKEYRKNGDVDLMLHAVEELTEFATMLNDMGYIV